MSWRRPRGTRGAATGPRVGLFGFIGSGNLGNDAAFEVVLNYLGDHHPDAVLDAMCMGPENLTSRYGIPAVPIFWYKQYEEKTSGWAAIGLKLLGKAVAAVRTASWVRRHDVVIVPGAGALEATLPIRASGYPYAMFLLCSSGRLFGTKVALVSVGANLINQRMTRWLFNSAARLATYRSYRDEQSRAAMEKRGVDVSGDNVYPDLVFGLETPPTDSGEPHAVGVGVMAYYGGNDDRGRAEELHARYVETMKRFIGWLVDSGRPVRLFWGDSNDDIDGIVVQDILTDLRNRRPELDPTMVVAEPSSSPAELMDALALVGTFVGTRYHNVVSALRLSKPTIAVGYSAKFDALMADMGLPEFCQPASSVNFDLLIEQFSQLERRAPDLRRILLERNQRKTDDLGHQFELLSSVLFPSRLPPLALVDTGAA